MRCVGRRGGVNAWWWNEEVKEVTPRKKDVRKSMCRNCTEENKRRFESMKNKARKAVLKAMREKVEEVLNELKHCLNWMFILVRGLIDD